MISKNPDDKAQYKDGISSKTMKFDRRDVWDDFNMLQKLSCE